MYSEKDIKYRTVLFLNALEGRSLSIRNEELLISETETRTTVSKLPFQKLIAVFIIGRCTISSPVLEALARHGVAFCLLKQSLRPLLWKADMAEGNYLLRRRQHQHRKEDISVAKILITNKIKNQVRLLERIPDGVNQAGHLDRIREEAIRAGKYEELILLEAKAAKLFFKHYFHSLRFEGRKPRLKTDPVNVSLDIGYTILFNFIESMLRLFGFDLYVGIYHTLFFQRKSLVCDVMEPFRCIIDLETKTNFGNRSFKRTDFEKRGGMYSLKPGKAFDYYKTYASAVLERKMEIFRFVRDYYRAFMKNTEPQNYPEFLA